MAQCRSISLLVRLLLPQLEYVQYCDENMTDSCSYRTNNDEMNMLSS